MKEFDEIWNQYEQELSTYVLSRVGDIEVQKEIMQEVAVKIFLSIHSQKKHLRGWLYQVSKNAIADYYRKKDRPLPLIEEEKEQETHIMQECLEPMLNQLRPQEKEILFLTQLEKYSLKEVASMKNITFNTAKSQLFRAKKALSRAFFSCCEYERNQKGEIVNFSSKRCVCE